MKTKVYCQIPEVFKGFRELCFFKKVVSDSWCKTGQFFPMYDEDSGELFECAFNPDSGLIVAYAELDNKEFRKRLENKAQELINMELTEAIIKASAKASELLKEAWFFGIE